jgi:hypothetical protein
MLMSGETYSYAPSGDTIAQFRKVGKEDQVRKVNGDLCGEWIAIKPSLMRPSDKSKMDIAKILGNLELVDDFIINFESIDKKRNRDSGNGSQRYPLSSGTTKEGTMQFDGRQTLMYVVEQMFKSSSENQVFNHTWLNLVRDDGTNVTFDMRSAEFANEILNRVDAIQLKEGLSAKALPIYRTIEENIHNIIILGDILCPSDVGLKTGVRFIARNNKIYYDMDMHQCVEISADGVNIIPRIKGFRRPPGSKDITDIDLTVPVKDLLLLAPRYPISGVDLIKHLAWLISVYFTEYKGKLIKTYGNLWIGPSTVGKTMGTSLTLDTLDPGVSHVFSAASLSKKQDMAIILGQGVPVIADNHGSEMKSEESDALCTAYDHIPFATRELFTNSGMVEIVPQTMPMITAVSDIKGMGSDLDTRIIKIRCEMPPANYRMTEIQVREYFDKYASRIRGAYINAMHLVLKNYDKASEIAIGSGINTRLVPFLAVELILAEEFGIDPNIVAMAAKEEESNALYISAKRNKLVVGIEEYLRDRLNDENSKSNGNKTMLVDTMEIKDWAETMRIKHDDDYVGAALLAGVFKRASVEMKAIGIHVEELTEEKLPGMYKITYLSDVVEYSNKYIKELNELVSEIVKTVCRGV